MEKDLKDILLKDLCARLHCVVMVHCSSESFRFPLGSITTDGFISPKGSTIRYDIKDGDIKPYLFPLSSMTEEQKEEFNTQSLKLQLQVLDEEIMYEKATEFEVDFFNKHHLDWRGLIPKGLALDATGLNIY